jgi:hypothetical protein
MLILILFSDTSFYLLTRVIPFIDESSFYRRVRIRAVQQVRNFMLRDRYDHLLHHHIVHIAQCEGGDNPRYVNGAL